MADLGSLLGAVGVGGTIGQAIVRLELDTAKYQAEMKSAQASTVASTNAMGTSTSKFAGLAKTAFLGVGVAAAAGVAVAVKAATDLNEQINKTKVVFESSADTVISFSETTAESLGISQRAALEYAGSFGQILDAAGLTTAATSDMSVELVALASDLASFNNIETTDALEKLQSGLSGMARPLRDVGVFISAARVENVAYRDGIAEVGEELTDAQKIQARYNIILEDTTKAQGDFQRTLGESLPNQMRVLKAELEDLAAKLGQSLLPPLLEFAKVIVDLVEDLGPLLDLVGKLGPAIHVLAEGFKVMLSPLTKVVSLFQEGVQPTSEMVDLIGSAAINLGAMQQKAEIAAAATTDLNKAAKNTKAPIDKLSESVEDFTLTLSNDATQADITRDTFITASRRMLHEARELNDALLEIKREDWVNPRYIAFLSDLGPQWLVGFANLTEEQQRRMQNAWKLGTEELDSANRSQDKILDGLRKLDGGTSKHTVIIDYRYEGFDPSKPGMSMQGVGQQR